MRRLSPWINFARYGYKLIDELRYPGCFYHSVLGSRFQVRPWLLRPVQWLHSPNNVPYCAAEVDLVMGCGSTDLV